MNDQYELFLHKFERKKTSDDCYTPPNIYETVAAWVSKRYGVDTSAFVRPFWPDADYREFDYPKGCVVVDNPPFSILSQIVRDYNDEGIRFFLFAPYLRLIPHACNVVAPASIVYENGAEIPTAFVTNLSPELVLEAAPDLCAALEAADKVNRAKQKRSLPKYELPVEIITSAKAGYIAKHGVALKIPKAEAAYIRTLDSMRAAGVSGIYGSGFLLSERAAAERAAAISWPLSIQERAAVKALGKNKAAG